MNTICLNSTTWHYFIQVIVFNFSTAVGLRDYYMTFSISALVLARESHIKPDSEARGLIWVDGWYQRRYGKFHVIIFLSHILHWPFPCIDFYIAKKIFCSTCKYFCFESGFKNIPNNVDLYNDVRNCKIYPCLDIWMEIPIQHDVYIWANYSVSSYLSLIPICWNVLIWLKYDFMHHLSLYK
jgi:hypothetical protein